MNIVHYFLGLPPLHSGGLQKYVLDLAIIQKKYLKDSKVILLFPASKSLIIKESRIEYYKKFDDIEIFCIVNPVAFSFNGIRDVKEIIKNRKNNYYSFFKEKKIDILHVHSLMGFSKDLLLAAIAANVKTIFTTHDYYGICPKINLFTYKNEICLDYGDGTECFYCNRNTSENRYFNVRYLMIHFPILYFFLYVIGKILKNISNLWKMRKKEKNILKSNNVSGLLKNKKYIILREYYLEILKRFDIILFNSNITKSVYNNYLDLANIRNQVLPVTHLDINFKNGKKRCFYVDENCVNILYMGNLDIKKGFFDLIKVFDEIKKTYTNWQLHIYGDFSNIKLKNYDKNYYKFYGKYNYNDLKKIFLKANILIIPSKWKETFGFIGLEAISHGVPVIVSENVGFSMLIKNNINGIIYKEDTNNKGMKEAIISILKNPKILYEYNKSILKNNFNDYLLKNHVNKIINIYRKLLVRKI